MTFGLSMDYEIFLLTRIRERFLQSGNTHDAVAYGVSTSARTITSAALIMIAVFIGFAFAGMPLVAEIGVACAVAIAVDATVVRLVMVPALMAMFAEWNWWLPAWLERILPSVDFEKPLPAVDLGDIVMIPDDISAPAVPSADLRIVLKSAARLKNLVPDAITVADPLAFIGCGRSSELHGTGQGQQLRRQLRHSPTGGDRDADRHQRRHSVARKFVGGPVAPQRRRAARHRARYGPSTRSRCGVAGSRSPWMRCRPRPRPTSRSSSGAARWKPPTSSCPPATGCKSRPAPRRCGSRAT